MTYFYKIYTSIFFSIVLLFGSISFLFLYSVYQNTLKQEKETAVSKEHIVYLLINSKISNRNEKINYQELGDFVKKSSGENFFLVDNKDNILYSAEPNLPKEKLTIELPPKEDIVQISDVQLVNNKKYLLLSEKIPDRNFGVVLVDPLVELTKNMEEFKMIYRFLLIGIIIASAIVSFLLANMLIKPIKQLIKTTEDISKGHVEKRVVSPTNDELGELGKGLNNMADKFSKDIDQIQQAKDSQDLFLANLAHEIRTPLTSISGYSQMLKWSDLEPDDLESVEYIYNESQRLTNLSKDILKLTQLNTYQLEVEPIKTTLIREDLELFFKGNESQHGFSISLEESELPLDYNLFKLMAYNIVLNSLNAFEKPSEIEIRGMNQKDSYQLKFSDNGPGIPADLVETVTEAFVTNNESRSDQHLGLGLSIVQKVVKLHQGNLLIESTERIGTTVIVTFKKELTNE